MHLPDSWRPGAERLVRVIGQSALIVLAVRLWVGTDGSIAVERVATPSLDSALVRWSAVSPSRIAVHASQLPDVRQRDWLVALRRAGAEVEWTTSDSSGGAVVVERGPLADSPSRITVVADSGRDVFLSDDLGPIDSTRAAAGGIVTWRASPIGNARVRLYGGSATAEARDSLVTRPALIVGLAGWESRFVVSALEEAGWTIAARLTVAPGAVVRQGLSSRIDTASLSAVVVLDSVSALDASEIARFVRNGGGVVASGAGARHPALRTLLPSTRAAGSPAEIAALLGPTPRAGLFTRTFTARAGAVALEQRAGMPVVLARRVGSGRVIATGYDDTWRLRMIPANESAPEAHRLWWSSLVSAVAHSRPMPRDIGYVDEAPFAATVAALGEPDPVSQIPPRDSTWPWDAILASLAGAAMLAEWLSRRLRGLS